MSNKTKYLIYRYLIPLIIFLFVWIILEISSPTMKMGTKGLITAGLAYLLSPKIKKINFLLGQNIQIKWFLLGKVILLPVNDE